MRREGGQTTILVLGLSLFAFSIAGLAVDGTKAFLFRRSLQNAADAAAIAAASELNVRRYYSSGGRSVALDPVGARRAAAEMLASRALEVGARIVAGGGGVTVELRGRVPTSFLRLVGIVSVPVAVEARSEPITGSD